jgi:hypothetical protein
LTDFEKRFETKYQSQRKDLEIKSYQTLKHSATAWMTGLD